MLEIKSYDDWSEETDELGDAPENRIKKYTDYVRSSYYKAGQLTKEVDDEIVAGVRDRLYSDGLLTEESGEEEVNSKLGSIAGSSSDKDTDARFVLEHLKANSTPQSQDPRTQALTNYLALKNINPSQAEQFRTTVDEVTSDRKLVREARISAADRGDYSVVAVDEDDGKRTFYTGPTAKPDKLSGEIDTLVKAGAISTSDLYAVNDVVKPINGGLSTTSENARYEMFRRAVGEKAKQDKDLNDLLAGQASAKKQEITESQQTLGEDILQGAKTVIAYPFERLAEGVMGVGRFLTGEEKTEPKYSLDTKLSDVLGGDENLRRRFSAEEIEKFSDALVTTAAGPVYRADRPETGISMDSMGNPLIASALLPNDEKFEAALSAAPLNKEQQSMARVQRDALLKSSTPDLLKVILDEEPDAASALAKFKADGKSDTDFVKSWVSDPNNYSGFETRLEQFGKGALKTIADIPLGIAALAGNEWAVNEMGKMMDDQARRREYSRLFGDEYELGFEIINTIPQVATDIGLTIGTGGVFAGAKTLAKAGAATGRTTLRTAAKIGLSTADDVAANAFKTAITAGGEETTGIAIKEMGRSLGAQFAENAPIFTTSFVRSASSTYASIYNQLPDDMSHEEKHKDSLGYALAAGLSTGVITTGMSFLGRGGVEDLATNRIRAMLGGETDEAVAAAGGKFVPVDKLNYRQAKAVYENLKTESAGVTDAAFRKALRGAIGSTYKNYLKTTFGGALSESVEEALDQAIQMKLEDASLNRDTPLVEQVNQIFTAGVIGGALGGLTSGSSQFGQVKQSELASVFEARASALDNVAKRLRETNSSATAETVQRLIDDARAQAAEANKLDAQARSEAEALKQKTIFSDPNEKQLESTEAELTMLGDLVGEKVSAAGFYGTVEVDDNGSAHLVTKSGEVVHLGSKYEKAAGRVSSYPQLMATATQIGSIPAGTPYISRGKKDTTKIAMPAVSEQNKPEDFLGVIKNEEGNIIQLVVKNAKLMSDQEFGMDIKIGNRYQMNSLARYYNVDLNSLQDLTPVAETEETANANDIDSIGETAVSPEAKDAIVTAKSILQQGPSADLYKAFMAGDSSKAKFKQTINNLSAGELDSVAETASAFYDWATSNESIPPEVRPRLIQGAEDMKARVALAAQIHIDRETRLEASKWDTISDEEKNIYNQELQDEQDALEAELNAPAAGQTSTLSDKDKAATQAALDAAQKKLGVGVSEPPQVTTKSGEAEGNQVIEGDDPQKILSNLIATLRSVNDEVPIIVESAEGFISPAAANRQTKQLKAAIQIATENEDTEQLKLLSDQLGKLTTRVYTMKEAEQIKTKLKFLAGFYKSPDAIAEVTERLGRLESAMSAGNRILSSRKSRLRKQIAELIPQDEEATTLTSDEQQLADMVSQIEGTRPPKPEVPSKPKRIKHEKTGEDWSTEDKLSLFRNESEERAFNSLVEDGIIVSNLAEWGATISAREQELLGFEGPQLFTKTRYLGDPTNPNKYIKGKHILLARKVLERFPLVEPPADASTIKSKNNYTDPVASKRGKIDMPVYRDKAQFVSEGVFTNDPRTSREFINMNIPVVIPPELIQKHKNHKDPFFINKSIDFDEDSGVVISVLDPVTREPKMFSGEETMVSNEGYLPYRASKIMNLLSGIMEPSPQYLKSLGNTVSGRQPVYGRGLPAREYLADFRRFLFEGEAIDAEESQLGGIETSLGYQYLKRTYGLSDESIASASTAAISEYTLGVYEYAMGQALRSYVSRAMLFSKNKGMDAVVKQALKDARAEYGDTLSKEELEQIPDSYFLKYIQPDKKALKDLDPIRVVSQFFYSNNKDAIAENITNMYPEFNSLTSSEAVISKYAETLFDRVNDPKGNLYTGPKQPYSILDHYGDLYKRAEIRRRKYTSFGGIGEENAGILDRLVTSGEARSSASARGVDDLAVDPLFVRSYDEVTGDPEATYAYKDSLRTSLIKTVNAEPQLQAALQDIAGSFDGSLTGLEGEQLVDVLTNVISNAGDRNVSLAVTNRLYALQNIAGLRAAGIMSELGWLPPVAGFKAVAPEVRVSTELESPEASRERLFQIISAAKDASYRAADMATPEEEATYRARLTEAVQAAQPEIQQALAVANEKSRLADLRARYRESMTRVLYKLEDGEEAFASAVSGLRNDITKGQDRLVKLEELIAGSDANISDIKLGVSKISKDQEALRPKFNELNKYLQSLIDEKNKGDDNVAPRLKKATTAFEKVNQQMGLYNGIISRYTSNLKFVERERNKLVNEQDALTKYLDRTTPIVTQLEGLPYAEAVKQIKASRRTRDLDSGTYTKTSEAMKLKARRIAREKAETIAADEKPYQKVAREAAAATAQLRYNSERSNLYKASNIATNAQLEAAARTANTRDIERYGLISNDRESMLGAFRAMAKSSVESHREVANLLLLAPDFIRSVRFGIVDVRSDWSGLYDSQTNTILLNVAGHNGRGLADVILHEYLHAATVTYFKNPRTAEQRAAVKRIGQIRQLAVAQATKRGLMKFAHVRDGLANDAEFLTYTLTAPEFQASLSLLTPPNQSSILSRIIDAILSFFGKKNFKLQEAVRELLDFTQMGLVNFHTYNVSTKRDTNALIEKGQYIRTEMEDTMFLQELLDDIMSGRTEDVYFAANDGAANPPAQLDAEYLAAVEAGDMQTAQRLVDEAAELAGFDTETFYYRGDGKKWNKLRGATYVTPELNRASNFPSPLNRGDFNEVRKFYVKRDLKLASLDQISSPDFPVTSSSFLSFEGYPMDALGQRVDELVSEGYDALAGKIEYVGGPELVVFNPAAIRLSDAVTRDDNGNVVPLSQRFRATSDDIRYIQAGRAGVSPIDMLEEVRRIVPEGIDIEIDDTMVGAMGANRRRPNTIIVNSKLINDIGTGLSVANAKAAVRTAVDEELAHLASYTVFTEQDFVNLANEMGASMLDRVADIYYSSMIPDYNERAARIAADRESGVLRDSDLAAEFVRMEMTDIAVGRNREQHLAFLYTNPSLLSRWLEALKAFISRLKQRFSEAPTTGTAARISQASRAFRKLREGGVLPLPQEAAADELGDSVALLNALNGDIIEGQEDRTRYMVPIATSGNRQQVDAFWKRVEDKYYNFPLELRKLLALRDGTLSEVEYTMENFSRMFPKLRDEALARGADIEDIGKVLGTTAPAIQRQARKAIRDQVKQFKINNATDPDLEVKAAEFERQITNTEANKFFAQFRQEQQQVESRLRASGFGELVDYLVEFRQEINKYKAVVNFDDSNDVYLTRSFRFFSSEGWALAAKTGGKVTIDGKEVDFDKLRAAALTHFEWEVDNAAKKNNEVLTKDQRDERLVKALDNYLMKIQLEAEESKELGPVRALRKDLNRMLTKQDFDSPLRKLLGEVEDPFENAVRTIYSVGRMAANERFLKDFADQAIAIGVADRKKGEGMELLFPPSQSAELGDLAGLYVDSKVAAAFREELGINMRRQDSRSAGMINTMGRWLSKFSGLTITAKTLGSVGFYPRNILGGIALTTAQGIVNPTNIKESARLAIAASLPIKQADSQEMRDKIRRLVELQVLRDDTRGRIAMDMLKGFVASTDEQLEELMNEIIDAQATGNIDKIAKRFDGLQKFGVKTVDFLAGLNNVIDSAFKLNAYFYELDVLKEAYGNSEPESTLEAMAAQKVKRTFPTHSDQVSLAKSFGRSPYAMLVLPFVRWKSEVFRTMFNTIPLAVQEMRSGNDVLVRRGAKRLVGFTSTMLFGSAVYGGVFATLFGLLTDDEDDERAALRKLNEQEMEALRLALPEWQRNHGVFAQKLKDGSVQVIDNTNILPYSQLTDLVGLATRGDIKGIADYLTSELVGTQIAAATALQLGQNRDDFGQPIWLQTDDGFTATVKMLKHLGKGTLLPSVVDKAVKVGRYGEQNAKEMIVGEFTGVRPIIHKQTDIEYRGMRNLKDSADAVVSLLYPLSGGRALDTDKVEGVIDDHQAASNTNQQKLHNFIVGMKSLGSTDESLANIAQQMKFSKQRFGAALDGVNIPWVPNKQWFQKMYDNKIRTGEQNPDEIAAKINEILSRKPDIYRVNEE